MSSAVLNGNSTLEEFNENDFNLFLLNGPNEVQFRTLNKLLSTSKTFEKGLECLNNLLNCSTIDAISDYVVTWMNYCLKHSGDNFTENKLLIIGKLIEISFSNNDVSKKIVSDYLSKIVDLCLKSKCEVILAALKVLGICMKRYGSWFIHHKIPIETLIISCLDNSSETIVDKAAIAFLFLQQVGNAGIDGINHRKSFRESLQKLCATLHNLIDQLFENYVDLDDVERPDQEGFKFNYQTFEAQLIAQRIKNVLKFITVMIKNGFTVYKEIFPMDILNIIKRGTMIHHCLTTIDNSTKDYQFSVSLTKIQVQLVHLLRVFILWLQNNSLPFAFIISKILIDCLKKRHNCKCFDQDIFYQETVYSTINSWIITSRTGFNSHFQEQLITCILKDITPVKNKVSLKIQVETGKKNKHVLGKNVDNEKSNYFKEKEELRCQLALSTLKNLFHSSYIQLEVRIVKDIYTLVTDIFNEINADSISHLYKNSKCQIRLFELLVAFYEQECLKNLPSISVSINILNNYSCSKNTEIADICKRGLGILEKICQPISLPINTFYVQTEASQPKETEVIGESSVLECITDLTQSVVDSPQLNETKVKIKDNSSEIIILDNKLITPAVSSESDLFVSSLNTTSESSVHEASSKLEDESIESEGEPSFKRVKIDVLNSSKVEDSFFVDEVPKVEDSSLSVDEVIDVSKVGDSLFVDEVKEY